MSSNWSKGISSFLIMGFVVIVILSFALTGFESFNSAPNAVASVDGRHVSVQEYNMALNQKIQQFSQIFGGNMTNQQIKQFQLRENTLNELVDLKLMVNFLDNNGVLISQEQIKKEIKDLPYFKTNNQFDINKYKQILQANSLTPLKFEENIAEDLLSRKINALFSSVSPSRKLAEDVAKLKQPLGSAMLVTFERESLKEFIKISNSQVNEFLKDENNKTVIESLYNSRLADYTQEEQVKARHILLKADTSNEKEVLTKIKEIKKEVTPENFKKLAEKYTEDPSGKNKGGDLGYFGKGRMVKEFEKVAFSQKIGTISNPVKTQFGYHLIYVEGRKPGKITSFDTVKKELTIEHLQTNAIDDMKKLAEDIQSQVKTALDKNDTKALSTLAKKYKINFQQNVEISLYDSNVKNTKFNMDAIGQYLLSSETAAKTINESDSFNYKFLKITKSTGKVADSAKERQALQRSWSQRLNNTFLKTLSERSTIKKYTTMM